MHMWSRSTGVGFNSPNASIIAGTQESSSGRLQACTGTVHYDELPVNSLNLELESSALLYRQGDLIKGHLIINVFSDLCCIGIEIALEGIGTVNYECWNKTVKKTKNLLITENWATVTLISNETPTNGVQPANYRIPFCIPIPRNYPLVGSFQGAFGDVQYRVAGRVHPCLRRTSVGSLHIFKSVQVESYFNLRAMPSTANRKTFEYSANNSFFSTISGPRLSFSLDRTGFVAGERIPFKMKMNNNAQKKALRGLKATLFRKVEYDFNAKSKATILDSVEIALSDDTNFQWEGSLNIPINVHPTTKRMLFRHKYFIQLETEASDSKNGRILGKNIPIVIGSVNNADCTVDSSWPFSRSVPVLSIESFADSENCTAQPSSPSGQRSSLKTREPSLQNKSQGCEPALYVDL